MRWYIAGFATASIVNYAAGCWIAWHILHDQQITAPIDPAEMGVTTTTPGGW